MEMQKVRMVYLLLIYIIPTKTSERTYQNSVKFLYYNERNDSVFQPNTPSTIDSSCKSKLAVIIHGWMESCETIWVPTLMRNLNSYRHGCIICMDYSIYAMTSNYYALVKDFNGLATVLTNKLKDFQRSSVDPNNIYMFGFSFGAQLALESGRRFGKKLIKQIDGGDLSLFNVPLCSKYTLIVCDPAGPGFDNNIIYSRNSPRNSAQNVQCIHTSSDKGTRKRDCHQNWNMGNCGKDQIAAGPRPMGSHGLCPYFYINAFQHKFPAIPKPKNCRSNKNALGIVSEDFGMGYLDALRYEGRFPEGQDFFANTFKTPPYNKDTGSGSNI